MFSELKKEEDKTKQKQKNTMAALVELERNFVLEAWAQRLRPDKRLFQQLRDVTIEFPFEDRGICLVKIGKTIVMSAVACELVEPSTIGGGKNGFLDFSVRDATPSFGGGSADGGAVVSMASSTRGGKQSGALVEITRLLEAVVKGAKVIDVEALCVVPGKFVWSLRVDVTILNQDGNVTDAAVWSTIAALQHFRRPEVSVLPGNRVVVHQPHERDPIPLNMHHFPITITAAVVPPSIAAASSATSSSAVTAAGCVAENDTSDAAAAASSSAFVVDFVIDPTVAELAASAGVVIVALNHEMQICDLHKEGAVAIPFQLIQKVIASAKSLVPQLAALMKEAMAKDEAKRKEAARAAFQWAKTRSGVGKS